MASFSPLVLRTISFLSLLSFFAFGEVYFNETFDDLSWKDRWTVSQWKPPMQIGEWKHTTGAVSVSETDKAIQTSEDARFYTISAPLIRPFSNEKRDFFLQFRVQHEQQLDCGGAYVKLMGGTVDPLHFEGDSPYSVMFGPDKCGFESKTHAILHYARPVGDMTPTNMDHRTALEGHNDQNAHLYALHIYHNNTYTILLDNVSIQNGTLAENWPFQPEQMMEDPSVTKPIDWVEEKEIPDETDVKPEGYDDIPSHIPDPQAEQPEDWDEEDDGEWEPPVIDNPEYPGEWKARMIPNPAYQGPWVHPKIENPDYFTSETFHAVCKECNRIGIDIWQVKSGTIFDDLFLTDDANEAEEHAKEIMEKVEKLKEKRMEMDEELKKMKEEQGGVEGEEGEEEEGEEEEEEEIAEPIEEEEEEEEEMKEEL